MQPKSVPERMLFVNVLVKSVNLSFKRVNFKLFENHAGESEFAIQAVCAAN